jgi:hypothetical protein
MNPRNTWLWVFAAAGLFAFIFFFERHARKPDTTPTKVLPGLKAAEIDQIQILPRGQLPIRAVRTNGTWRLVQPAPLDYPAQEDRINVLLAVLEQLTPAPYISAQDLKNSPSGDEQFGFDSPQTSLMIGQKKYHILVGNRTAPGDQVFLQVVGIEGVFVVDAALLKLIPQSATEWRETAIADWTRVNFDHLTVTSAGKTLGLARAGTNSPWRIILPRETRADSDKINAALEKLKELQVGKFVSDDPKADLDSFGLQTPDLSLTFLDGTNRVLSMDFGKSVPGTTNRAYARRTEENAIVTVPKDIFQPWLFSQSHDFRDFFDHHLVSLTTMPDEIDVQGEDKFTLERQTNDTWGLVPEEFPIDAGLLKDFLNNLTNLQVTEIVREIVPDGDLPLYGLTPPVRQYVLKAVVSKSESATNRTIAQLQFGEHEGKIFARREDFIYAIDPSDFRRLPGASWKFRERRIWNFSETNVARVIIQQGGRTRELIRKEPQSWSLGPTSQGIMDEVLAAAIEESVHRLGNLTAAEWVQRGTNNFERFEFQQTSLQLTIELKTGEKLDVKFGKEAPSKFPYAAVDLNNETWVFEFPWAVYQYVQMYLTIPANIP